ncbi:hypothetical protein PHMEG_00020950 [Phytophthora megakarya]|uniref:Uncharacterized protein n=1 Tax=Phytophthora megakarya TaxID=4795 RepID=A0A225VPD9_9STRA|nr:hypothetical protein PHMEG_00020950 [Phytophthora megakarya]
MARLPHLFLLHIIVTLKRNNSGGKTDEVRIVELLSAFCQIDGNSVALSISLYDGYENVINNLKKRGLMTISECKRDLKATEFGLLALKLIPKPIQRDKDKYEVETVCINVSKNAKQPFIQVKSFIQANSLEDKVETHDSMLALTMANTETCHVKKRTITLTLRITEFNVYSAEVLVLPVPDERDKAKHIEYDFAFQPHQSQSTIRKKATRIDDFKGHSVYLYLCKYPDLFRQKLPAEHGEHTMDVKTDDPVFRQLWRQSPAQEAEIMRWVREMEAAGLIRRSMSPHGAPTFCVKKPDGWRIVHD